MYGNRIVWERKRRSLLKSKKAISPVISTIVIVSVAIAMSIAVSYWMMGITGSFTRFERLDVTSAYAVVEDGSFTIKMKVKNSGSASATIDLIFVNGRPTTDYAGVNVTNLLTTLEPGQTVEDGTIVLPKDGTFVSGMGVEVVLQTAAGRQYPKTVQLP